MAYFRLNGKTGYGYRYTDRDLQVSALLVPRERANYCLFNNVSMGEDALRFAEMAGVGTVAATGPEGRLEAQG